MKDLKPKKRRKSRTEKSEIKTPNSKYSKTTKDKVSSRIKKENDIMEY